MLLPTVSSSLPTVHVPSTWQAETESAKTTVWASFCAFINIPTLHGCLQKKYNEYA